MIFDYTKTIKSNTLSCEFMLPEFYLDLEKKYF